MARVDVLGPAKDYSRLCVVGEFDSEDVEVFEQAPPPGPGYLLTRSEKQEVHQLLLRTNQGRWIMRLDFGAQGIEHRYVENEVATAWLYRNGYIESALEA